MLWLLHGAAGGTDTWIPGITKLAAGLPAVIVMPDGGKFGMYADWWHGGQRGDPAWATYHLKLLRRTVERRYRIRPGRRWHAIGGISMGGQGTLRYAAMLPGYFGSAVGFSAAFPDTQSRIAQDGLTLFAGTNGATGAGYDDMFGPAVGSLRRGEQSAGARAQLQPHPPVPDLGRRQQLPAGPDRPHGPGARPGHRADHQRPAGPVRRRRPRRGRRRDGRDHLRRPHLRRLGPGLRQGQSLGLLQAGARAAARAGSTAPSPHRARCGASASASPPHRPPSRRSRAPARR